MRWKIAVAALFVASAAGATGYYVSSPTKEPMPAGGAPTATAELDADGPTATAPEAEVTAADLGTATEAADPADASDAGPDATATTTAPTEALTPGLVHADTAAATSPAPATAPTLAVTPVAPPTIAPITETAAAIPIASGGAYVTVSGELDLTVSGLTAGTTLAWTPRTPKAFGGYRIVRSETDPDPYYPKSGYLVSVADSSATQWVDKSSASGKTYWYRVCSITTDGSPTACGNVVRFQAK